MKTLSVGEDGEEVDGGDEGEVNGENGERSPRAPPRWGGGEFCPRCDKQVFIAERKQAAGNVSGIISRHQGAHAGLKRS